MAHRKLDRVQQTTTWTGVGGLALDGPAPARMRTFASVLSNGDQCWVLIEHQTAAEWEISLATYSAGAITRTFTAYSSSATGGLVNFSAGLKTVSLCAPAGAAPITDGLGNMTVTGNITANGSMSVYNTTPEMKLVRSDNGQGWAFFNWTANSDVLAVAYLTAGQWAANVATFDRTGAMSVYGSLGVGITAPAGLGHFRKTQNTNTDLVLENLSSGAAASARIVIATGTPNSYMAMGVADNAGAPIFELSGGPALGRMVYSVASGGVHEFYGGVVRPMADNLQSSADASHRWSVVFAGTGTINTSDQTEKQDIRALDAAELRVAKALAALVRVFRWKAAVAEKGDAARLHTGWIAQQVVAAFEAESLDAFKYGCVGFDLVTKREPFTEQRTREKKRDVEVIDRVVEILDGQPVEVAKTVTRQEPVGVFLAIVNEQGQPVMVQPPTYTDGQGNVVSPDPVPRLHFVPTMEIYTHTGEREVPDIDPETNEQRKRYNVRPDQIAAFIFAGLGDRVTSLETP